MVTVHLAEGVHDGHRGGGSVGVGGHDTDHTAVAGLQLSSNNTKNDIYSCTAPIREVEKRAIVNKLKHISARSRSLFSHCLNWGSMCRIPDAQSSCLSSPKVCFFSLLPFFIPPTTLGFRAIQNALSRFTYAFFFPFAKALSCSLMRFKLPPIRFRS